LGNIIANKIIPAYYWPLSEPNSESNKLHIKVEILRDNRKC